MKIERMMRFPHPVLWSETNDYAGTAFAAEIEVTEVPATGKVQMACKVALTEPALQALCASDKASSGLSVVCLETYYNRLFEIPLGTSEILIESGQVRGQVICRPMLWATRKVTDFSSPSIHSEFGNTSLNFDAATILALGDEIIIDVGMEKLAPIGSVFALALDESVPNGQVALGLDDDKIQILAANTTLEWIAQMRNSSAGKVTLLSSVYLPSVMGVLNAIRASDSMYEDKRWFRVFRAKLTSNGISLETDDILEVAQQLLKAPLGKLISLSDLRP